MIDGVTVQATSTLIVEASFSKNRYLLVLCNNSDEDMYIAPGPVAVSTQGLPLVKGGGSFTDKPDSQGRMYQGMYHGICASGGKVLSVTELNE